MTTQRLFFVCVAATLILSTAATSVLADQDSEDRSGRNEPYSIGLWGDLPYSDVQALVGVPNLIADMNRQDLAFHGP